MIGIDTNVLVRYVVRDDEDQFERAAAVLADLAPARPGFITQVTLVEFYWVLTRSYGYSRDTVLTVISQLVSSTSLEFDDAEGVVRALTLAQEGADFADALIAGAMEPFGITDIVTFDRRAAGSLGWHLLTDEATHGICPG
ncbi:type II toxin-antitoxin system VapC family toxin [Ornithinimicrobium sp. F0845]|uniref:PIN domain-containing protein n=1 Tax=Ornithinimicrobium sp. F0845 TaxID=2926412 RepID=UPI001FF4DE83|nr:type II toxin-antitoxin system VapC family toxin [Ornithinimicrobium sp. F0845]MCK0110579.1 type II toxin-antitoxin system VapC family toxin [Ornithinimicrobium sp. F0845]